MMYEDDYELSLSGTGYELETDDIDCLEQALAAERAAKLELQMVQDEQKKHPQIDESPEKKKLKREIQQEALARLESAARTLSDFENVIAWWDKMDANRERRERYHEVSRSGDDIPWDYGATKDGLCFPDMLNSVLDKQIRKGDFLDVIYNCPYEIHELVTEEYLSIALAELSDDHKEVLYFSAVRSYSSQKIANLRGQTDRNIRKVRNTLLRKIYRTILPILQLREEMGCPVTLNEKRFLIKMKKVARDEYKGG